jgi:hypothetical protein
MSVQSFEIIRVPILELPFGNPNKKCLLDVALAKSHRIYYKEGSGALSQRMWAI